jgi:hypothetical protein
LTVKQGHAAATCSIYPNTRLDRNYDERYPSSQWKDSATYVYCGLEENIINGTASGFTYYMDERDQEWLDRKMRRLAEKARALKAQCQSPEHRHLFVVLRQRERTRIFATCHYL